MTTASGVAERRGSGPGFTLVEVLVSMAMLAVVAAAVFGAFSVITSLNRNATLDQEATVAARTFLEDLRAEWSDEAAYDAATLPTVPAGCNVELDAMGTSARTVTLTCDSSPDPFVVVLGRPSP